MEADMSLDDSQTLVLNADYRPVNYFPLSLWSWQDAVQAVFGDRVDVVAEYDQPVRSPSTTIKLPSVVALRSYIALPRRPAFSRSNLFLRDEFRCQYCGQRFKSEDLTFDHLVPRSRGGCATWTNIVTACMVCNVAKGSRTLAECGMRPLTMPAVPTARQLYENGRAFPRREPHATWRDYLYWNVELEPD
jgi:5-methylcytosine-specific restriction endonuclease McrA